MLSERISYRTAETGMEKRKVHPVNARAIMELRRRTGGMSLTQCKFLLAETGSVEAAEQWLRVRRPLPGARTLSVSERCPSCGGGLRFSRQMDCPHCGWLRVPPIWREAWGKSGPCPSCGFMYRWDGVRCSHCGHGSPAASTPEQRKSEE
jgi:hypothetical protein